MARKNRIQIPNGVYLVNMRTANGARLFADDALKDRIQESVLGVADYSGVELLGYSVLDGGVSLLVNVPQVPRRLWLDPKEVPPSQAYGMRPPECRVPIWPPEGTDPRAKAPLGFMMDDGEMLGRLGSLYGKARAGEMRKRWLALRSGGRGAEVDREKERHCRRMYSLPQFAKTLAETVARIYCQATNHRGHVWGGRFHSGVVENVRDVLAVVAAYVDYGSVRARQAASPGQWRWSGFARACEGDARARKMYETIFGCPWSEAKSRMERIFADAANASLDEESIARFCLDAEAKDAEGDSPRTDGGTPVIRASQLIGHELWCMERGGYLGRSLEFGKQVAAQLPAGYPRVGFRSLRHCMQFDWRFGSIPVRAAA